MNQTTEQAWIPKDTLEQVKTKAFLEMVEMIKALELQLASAQSRIRELESQVFGGSVKWEM